MSAVIPEDRIDQWHVQPPESLCILLTDPTIIVLHALHILCEFNPYQFRDQPIRITVKESIYVMERAAGYRLILLSEYVGAGQRTKKSEALHIFRQGGVEAVHANKFDIVARTKTKQLLVLSHPVQVAGVIKTEIVIAASKSSVTAIDQREQLGYVRIHQT